MTDRSLSQQVMNGVIILHTTDNVFAGSYERHGPSSASAPSPSAVQVSGTRFLLTSAPAFCNALKTYLFSEIIQTL